eukprot:TRINITY_DN15766_c0_g2_i1.p1 TRINITY_DN15766_c0_g2~~TRINITY_DN15766_c0_g2_i1.p1  ORF type:complete len:246 (-),score=24.10 TRINITY_DN15766_c0_g2_i1:100-837(-)
MIQSILVLLAVTLTCSSRVKTSSNSAAPKEKPSAASQLWRTLTAGMMPEEPGDLFIRSKMAGDLSPKSGEEARWTWECFDRIEGTGSLRARAEYVPGKREGIRLFNGASGAEFGTIHRERTPFMRGIKFRVYSPPTQQGKQGPQMLSFSGERAGTTWRVARKDDKGSSEELYRAVMDKNEAHYFTVYNAGVAVARCLHQFNTEQDTFGWQITFPTPRTAEVDPIILFVLTTVIERAWFTNEYRTK